MDLSIFQSGTSTTPSTGVSSSLPTLVLYPMLYCLSPPTQPSICVWILSFPWSG